jgi:hypothetical protein
MPCIFLKEIFLYKEFIQKNPTTLKSDEKLRRTVLDT